MHVSVSRCAEMLTELGDVIGRPALSRYCDTHGLKVGKVGRDVMVDFETVRDHRKVNYQREVMGGAAPEPAAQPEPKVVNIPPRDDPARQLKELALKRERREDAVEEGLLASVAEMDAGAALAIVEMRAAFAEKSDSVSRALAGELGLPPEKLRTLRAGLKRYARLGQEVFAERMARTLAMVNEPQAEALDRLAALAIQAARLRSVRNPAFEVAAVS